MSKLIKVFYDTPSPGGYKYLQPKNIVSIESLKRGWKDCTLVIDVLGNKYYMNTDVEESKDIIEGREKIDFSGLYDRDEEIPS